jgi:hypothetical protein
MEEPYHQSGTETNKIDSLNTDRNGHKTHVERCMSIMPVSCYWGWAIAGAIVFTGSFIILDIFENSFVYSELYVILSFIMVWQSIIIIWSHNKIKSFKEILIEIVDLPMDQIVRKYNNQHEIIFDDKKMALSGLLMILFAHILSLDYIGIPFQSNISKYFIYFIYYTDCYLLGAGFYIMIMTAFAVNKIGELPLNIKVVFSKKVQIIGVLYSKLTILAASVYIIWGIFHIMTPMKFSSPHMVTWFAIFGIFIIIFFTLPQYGIHRMMVKTKNEKTERFSLMLRSKLCEAFENPTEKNLSCLKNLLQIQNKIDKMSEWPFSSYEVLHIVLIVLIPLIIVGLELLLRIIKG